VAHERGRSRVGARHTAMQRVELLEESDERMNAPHRARAVVLEFAELTDRGELIVHERRHVALDARRDAGASHLEKDERLHRRGERGTVLAGDNQLFRLTESCRNFWCNSHYQC
jgi:hypothetical protein